MGHTRRSRCIMNDPTTKEAILKIIARDETLRNWYLQSPKMATDKIRHILLQFYRRWERGEKQRKQENTLKTHLRTHYQTYVEAINNIITADMMQLQLAQAALVHIRRDDVVEHQIEAAEEIPEKVVELEDRFEVAEEVQQIEVAQELQKRVGELEDRTQLQLAQTALVHIRPDKVVEERIRRLEHQTEVAEEIQEKVVELEDRFEVAEEVQEIEVAQEIQKRVGELQDRTQLQLAQTVLVHIRPDNVVEERIRRLEHQIEVAEEKLSELEDQFEVVKEVQEFEVAEKNQERVGELEERMQLKLSQTVLVLIRRVDVVEERIRRLEQVRDENTGIQKIKHKIVVEQHHQDLGDNVEITRFSVMPTQRHLPNKTQDISELTQDREDAFGGVKNKSSTQDSIELSRRTILKKTSVAQNSLQNTETLHKTPPLGKVVNPKSTQKSSKKKTEGYPDAEKVFKSPLLEKFIKPISKPKSYKIKPRNLFNATNQETQDVIPTTSKSVCEKKEVAKRKMSPKKVRTTLPSSDDSHLYIDSSSDSWRVNTRKSTATDRRRTRNSQKGDSFNTFSVLRRSGRVRKPVQKLCANIIICHTQRSYDSFTKRFSAIGGVRYSTLSENSRFSNCSKREISTRRTVSSLSTVSPIEEVEHDDNVQMPSTSNNEPSLTTSQTISNKVKSKANSVISGRIEKRASPKIKKKIIESLRKTIAEVGGHDKSGILTKHKKQRTQDDLPPVTFGSVENKSTSQDSIELSRRTILKKTSEAQNSLQNTETLHKTPPLGKVVNPKSTQKSNKKKTEGYPDTEKVFKSPLLEKFIKHISEPKSHKIKPRNLFNATNQETQDVIPNTSKSVCKKEEVAKRKTSPEKVRLTLPSSDDSHLYNDSSSDSWQVNTRKTSAKKRKTAADRRGTTNSQKDDSVNTFSALRRSGRVRKPVQELCANIICHTQRAYGKFTKRFSAIGGVRYSTLSENSRFSNSSKPEISTRRTVSSVSTVSPIEEVEHEEEHHDDNVQMPSTSNNEPILTTSQTISNKVKSKANSVISGRIEKRASLKIKKKIVESLRKTIAEVGVQDKSGILTKHGEYYLHKKFRPR